MALVHKYVYLYIERIVIYVDTPWIQQLMYASMKMAGFVTLTGQILVANINIMATGNAQLSSPSALRRHYEKGHGVRTLARKSGSNGVAYQQFHGRLNRLGQKHAVIRHCIKVKDSFHDYQDRVMLTKWACQLSAESNVKSWLSGALREMFLFEIMKTYTDLVDSNVFMRGQTRVTPFLYDAYLDQQTALPGSLPEKNNAQLSAIARNEETAMIESESESEKNTGPEADQDVSMEKLRDMRDQLRHQTLATVPIAN
ncbi:hypothetical protein A0O28_0068820 [Trichoderma guizhouense]|uniref:Uncharacterized protein n=1 Tax=Trichoderma guizhouense TaxID=1491466 RepID=A0A1T3D077_9HYPO|nr:hypothetical protein A0O28_0068820 [Trichoderma guizhouense]